MKGLYTRILVYAAIFLTNAILISLLYMDVLTLTAVLFVLLLVTLKYDYNTQNLSYVIGGAVLGPIAEIICVYFGVWRYANPTFLGIPLWLPIAWGVAALAIIKMSKFLTELRK